VHTPHNPPVHPLRRIGIAVGFLLALVVYGTAGLIVIEGYPFLDALYMTVITITTVGYGEIHHLDTGGQIFIMSVIVFGVLGFLYTLGVLIELLSSGDWQRHRRFRRMEARLNALRDHVIVCGYGRTGRQVVRELASSGAPYVVVEWNPEGLANVEVDDVVHLVGDAANDEVLLHAGIERARGLVSAVDSDERNVYIVLTARALNPVVYVVARASFPDSVDKLTRAGADRVVSPYTLAGRRMAALALQPAVVDTFEVLTRGTATGMRVEELMMPTTGADELTVGDLRRSGAVLLALRSSNGNLRVGPPDGERLTPDDIVVAMGTREQLSELASRLRPTPTVAAR
jgi:voltage-gated potassium channel